MPHVVDDAEVEQHEVWARPARRRPGEPAQHVIHARGVRQVTAKWGRLEVRGTCSDCVTSLAGEIIEAHPFLGRSDPRSFQLHRTDRAAVKFSRRLQSPLVVRLFGFSGGRVIEVHPTPQAITSCLLFT